MERCRCNAALQQVFADTLNTCFSFPSRVDTCLFCTGAHPALPAEISGEIPLSQNTDTPRETLLTATLHDALPASRLALLGTIIKPDSVSALVRLGATKVQSVTIGDQVDGAMVVAIDEGVMVLSESGQTRKLTLPGD